ncbi:F0F1 ATP synthase subunit gamma, partial [Chloroflexota bacterium]
IDAVYLSYTQFVTTMSQRPVVIPVLPVEPSESTSSQTGDFLFEPNPEAVLSAILEAIASEQSARMVAMRNATENAGELISDLTLMYNKARQESITTELLDISAGVEALS